jgi:hypothetical protein
VERASLLIEQAKAIGEPPEDPLLLFAVLGGSFAANVLAGKVEACHDVATRMLDLAEKQQASAPLVSLIDSVVEQLSQVFMLRVFHVGTIC